MKKIVCTLLALAVAVLPCLYGLALSAAAEEGEAPSYQDVEPSGDDEPGEPDPPPDDPPPDDPTPPPDDPTEPPDDPTPPPDDPTEPPDDPTPPPDDDPTPPPDDTPTPEPTPDSGSDQNGGYTGGGNTGGSTGGTTTGGNTGGNTGVRGGGSDIQQPSFSPRSTLPPITTSRAPSEAEASKEPRYITFAKVTQKTNSMSRVLFYSGASCIGVGVLGLVVLAIFIIRNRHIDERNEIFEEIAQAESRQPTQQLPLQGRDGFMSGETGEDEKYTEAYPQDGYGDYAQGYDAPQPPLHRPEPESLAVPVNGSLYTEEFELPQPAPAYQEQWGNPVQGDVVRPVQASMYTEEFVPPRAPYQGDVPELASMYTEEFVLPEDMAQPPAPVRRPAQPPMQRTPQTARQVPPEASQPRRPQQPPARDTGYDTAELLREILHGDEQP